MVIKKCLKCGAEVLVHHDCTCENCGIKCCGEQMAALEPNTYGLEEKHMPVCHVGEDKKLHVTVNHEMDENHYIEWICFEEGNTEKFTYYNPGDVIDACYCHTENVKVYSYCSNHGLWVKEL